MYNVYKETIQSTIGSDGKHGIYMIAITFICSMAHQALIYFLIKKINFTFYWFQYIVVVVVLLFYVHGKHLRSCRDGQLT